jgi:hypothetical protein
MVQHQRRERDRDGVGTMAAADGAADGVEAEEEAVAVDGTIRRHRILGRSHPQIRSKAGGQGSGVVSLEVQLQDIWLVTWATDEANIVIAMLAGLEQALATMAARGVEEHDHQEVSRAQALRLDRHDMKALALAPPAGDDEKHQSHKFLRRVSLGTNDIWTHKVMNRTTHGTILGSGNYPRSALLQ